MMRRNGGVKITESRSERVGRVPWSHRTSDYPFVNVAR
jgi:hypothetical protein